LASVVAMNNEGCDGIGSFDMANSQNLIIASFQYVVMTGQRK